MRSHQIRKNPAFVGRRHEIERLDDLMRRDEATFLVVYGRRRVGKTELIEQYFRDRTVLKFEGIEPDGEDHSRTRAEQIGNCLKRLAHYLENPLLARVTCDTWTDFFELVNETAVKEDVVLYFEEVQWLCGYRSDFFAELKPFWDDSWRHNKKLDLVLCGSSVSFIINQFLSNRALYSRAQEEIHLKPFSFVEIAGFLSGMGPSDLMTAQLTVGGICEYLKQIKGRGTLITSLCRRSFLPNAFFAIEFDKIFVSSLASNRNYRTIIEYLSKRKFGSVNDLEKACNVKGGGHLTDVLIDLEKCGFIQRYAPLHKGAESKLVRYSIDDEYLHFYYRFIHPIRKRIENGDYRQHPEKALNRMNLNQTLGYSFERWCRKNHALLARIMGFSGVEYESGAFFDRKSCKLAKGFQIDMMFIIKGSKIVICEIRYGAGNIRPGVQAELVAKRDLFLQSMPKYRNHTFETALITTVKGNQDTSVFDHVITLDQICDSRYWDPA